MDGDSEYGEMMDTHQVAAYLRVKERKVYDLVRARRIPCVRVTGKWLFPKADIDAWLRRSGAPGREGGPLPMVLAGSHDPLLEWALREVGGKIAVLPGESSDGLARMARGEAALAGLHMLDPVSGEYNIPHVEAVLGSHNVVLVEWAMRQQGVLVAPGNPLGVTGIDDLATGRARVVLRQDGSGSRILFDHLADRAGLTGGRMAVASAVARSETDVGMAILDGTADAGLAVASVARSLRLGFIALCWERYDLAIDRRAYFEPAVQALMTLAAGPEFKAKAEALGGYDVSGMGRVRWNAR